MVGRFPFETDTPVRRIGVNKEFVILDQTFIDPKGSVFTTVIPERGMSYLKRRLIESGLAGKGENIVDATIRPLAPTEREYMLQSDSENLVSVALISTALYDSDRKYAHSCSKRFLFHTEPSIINAAILAIAHCSRIDKEIELNEVQMKKLQELATNDAYAGRISEAVDDITIFTNLERSIFESFGIV